MCLCHSFRTDHYKLEIEGQNTVWYTCQQVINSVADLEVNISSKNRVIKNQDN